MHFKNEFFLTDLNRDNSIDIFEFLYSANQNISYKPEDSAAQAEQYAQTRTKKEDG